MIVLPAIDLKDGKCVRLYKGDFDTVHQVADDPLAVARAFAEAGAKQIHMVDLDGAKSGERKKRGHSPQGGVADGAEGGAGRGHPRDERP